MQRSPAPHHELRRARSGLQPGRDPQPVPDPTSRSSPLPILRLRRPERRSRLPRPPLIEEEDVQSLSKSQRNRRTRKFHEPEDLTRGQRESNGLEYLTKGQRKSDGPEDLTQGQRESDGCPRFAKRTWAEND